MSQRTDHANATCINPWSTAYGPLLVNALGCGLYVCMSQRMPLGPTAFAGTCTKTSKASTTSMPQNSSFVLLSSRLYFLQLRALPRMPWAMWHTGYVHAAFKHGLESKCMHGAFQLGQVPAGMHSSLHTINWVFDMHVARCTGHANAPCMVNCVLIPPGKRLGMWAQCVHVPANVLGLHLPELLRKIITLFQIITLIQNITFIPSRGQSTAAAPGISHLPTHLGHTPDGPAP